MRRDPSPRPASNRCKVARYAAAGPRPPPARKAGKIRRPHSVDAHARLMTIPGVGPVTASAIVATIQDAGAFASGREFAAFLGLTPRQNSTGGKTRLGRITKMGDRYLRKLPVIGACATLRHRKGHNDAMRLCPE